MNKSILPDLGVSADGTCDHRVGLLWDDFKAHSCPAFKEYCLSFSCLAVLILGGGLTPEPQPLEKVVNKVLKGYFCCLYDDYIITALIGNNVPPKAPTRQIITTWIVKTWDMISLELVRKSWTACGYPAEDQLTCSNEITIVVYDDSQV